MTVFLFAGDSVTDCGRTFFDPRVEAGELGDGWVRILAALLGHREAGAGHRFLNAGVAGDRVDDLRRRWARDVEPLSPEVLTVLVGVNDSLRDPRTPVDRFAAGYAALLDAVPDSVRLLVVAEPFVVPVDEHARALRRAARPHLDAVRAAAAACDGAVLLELDRLFTGACEEAPPAWWAPDGVHPSAAGHGLIAEAWLAAVDGRQPPAISSSR